MAAYTADSPQGRAAAALIAAGVVVNPLLRGDSPGQAGQAQVRIDTATAVDPVTLTVRLIASVGADLWSLLVTAWDALAAVDGLDPIIAQANYDAVADGSVAVVDISVITDEVRLATRAPAAERV